MRTAATTSYATPRPTTPSEPRARWARRGSLRAGVRLDELLDCRSRGDGHAVRRREHRARVQIKRQVPLRFAKVIGELLFDTECLVGPRTQSRSTNRPSVRLTSTARSRPARVRRGAFAVRRHPAACAGRGPNGARTLVAAGIAIKRPAGQVALPTRGTTAIQATENYGEDVRAVSAAADRDGACGPLRPRRRVLGFHQVAPRAGTCGPPASRHAVGARSTWSIPRVELRRVWFAPDGSLRGQASPSSADEGGAIRSCRGAQQSLLGGPGVQRHPWFWRHAVCGAGLAQYVIRLSARVTRSRTDCGACDGRS